MTVWQAWLFFGVPCLALGLAMFVGSKMWRTMIGYLLLIVGFATMTVFDRLSGAVFGAVIALMYAAGRGGDMDAGRDPLTQTSHEAIAGIPEPAARYTDRPLAVGEGDGTSAAGGPRVS